MAEALEGQTEDALSSQEMQTSWSQIWQVPSLLLGMAILALGVYLAMPGPQKNQFSQVLQEVALYLKARNLDQAQVMLQTKLEPFIERATKLEKAEYELLWGDLVFLQQQVNHWDKIENHQSILNHYRKAQDIGGGLSVTHLQRLAQTLVAMKRDVEALAVLDRLKDAPAHRRYQVIRRIIERRRDAGDQPQALAPLITRFEDELRLETDPQVRRQQQMWSVSLQAKGLLDIDQAEQAIAYLQRRMIHFMAEAGDDDLAPLRVILAKAFEQLGAYEEAQRWYRLAQQKLPQTDLLNADVLVGLAKIELAQTGDVRGALENFSHAEAQYPTAPAYIEALVGRADCEARLGEHPEAIEHFGLAIEIVMEHLRPKQDQIAGLVDAIHAHFDLNAGRQDFDLALDYLSLLKLIYRSQMPPRQLQEFAVTHHNIADQRLAAFDQAEAGAVGEQAELSQGGQPIDPGAKRLAMQTAAVHYAKAGEYYLQHAQAVTGIDDDGFGHSLWLAAMSYDKAQLWEKAIEVYAEFIKARPDDPRQLEAINHLGFAYQSDGQFAVAADLFEQLIEEHKNTPEAYKSLVPLARCHIAMAQFDDAERVLLYVVTDHPAITPESLQYQEALIELGKLYYQTRRFEPAIARLVEAVDRYGQMPQGAVLEFRLADAYRLSISQIDSSLEKMLPQKKQMALRAERARRLEQAQTSFGQVISRIEGIPVAMRSPMEKLCLRNAFFYRADCAYDLGRYEQAISLYDLAAKRWEAHPASLVALVQIVNAYCEMGKTHEAKIANDRARWQLKRIPDEAFDDPNLPMTREHWQQWLRWTSELNLFGSQASAADGR